MRSETVPSDLAAPPEATCVYLTCVLAGEEYGIEIVKVCQIIGMTDIRSVPHTPPYVLGVFTFRDRIIPVIDLAAKLGTGSLDVTGRPCIVVASAHDAQVGLVVDSVSEVSRPRQDDLEPVPGLGLDVDTNYLSGIARDGERVRLLLDLDRVLSPEDVTTPGQ